MNCPSGCAASAHIGSAPGGTNVVGEEVFGSFHTHPENPDFESEPSQADRDSTQTTIEDFGLTDSYEGCFIVNDNAIWHVDTDGNVSQVSNTGP